MTKITRPKMLAPPSKQLRIVVAAASIVLACGADRQSNGPETGTSTGGTGVAGMGGTSAAGVGGSAQGGTVAGGSGGSGAGEAGASGSATRLGCTNVAPPRSGEILGARVALGGSSALDLDASCDGSFLVTGSGGFTFARADGGVPEVPDGTRWIARFGPDGFPVWAASQDLQQSGSGGPVAGALFPDGSAAIAGHFGAEVTFGIGEPNETTLYGEGVQPVGYVARYAADGRFLWARNVGTRRETYVLDVAGGPDGTTYVQAHNRLGGLVIGPGELELEVGEDEGAVVALNADGRFVHGIRYYTTNASQARLTTVADGSVVLVSDASEDAAVGVGSSNEMRVARDGVLCARLSSALEPLSLFVVPYPVGSVWQAAVFPDGSIAFARSVASDTIIGEGEPNETLVDVDVANTFLAKFDPDGHLAWVTKASAEDGNVNLRRAVAVADGSLAVYGELEADSAVDMVLSNGTGVLTVTRSANSFFVAKLSVDGSPVWVRNVVSDAVAVEALTASPLGTVLAGYTLGTVTFEATPPVTFDLGSQYTAFFVQLGP